MKKKCSVVLLPVTEDVSTSHGKVSKIRIDNNGRMTFEPHIQGLYYSGLTHIYQHIYILSDEAIKEKDWIINGIGNIVNVHCYNNDLKKHQYIIQGALCEVQPDDKKIIATTDKSILGNIDSIAPQINDRGYISYPSPSPEFIQKYVDEYNNGNQITRVMVEYDINYSIPCKEDAKGCSTKQFNIVDCTGCSQAVYAPKVDKNNYITITRIKDSWNRDDVVEIIKQFNFKFGTATSNDLHEWAEKNL